MEDKITVPVEIQSYQRLARGDQQFWIFPDEKSFPVSLGVNDIVIFTMRGQSDLVRKITHVEELGDHKVASLVPHAIAKVAKAFAPKGGYSGSFH